MNSVPEGEEEEEAEELTRLRSRIPYFG